MTAGHLRGLRSSFRPFIRFVSVAFYLFLGNHKGCPYCHVLSVQGQTRRSAPKIASCLSRSLCSWMGMEVCLYSRFVTATIGESITKVPLRQHPAYLLCLPNLRRIKSSIWCGCSYHSRARIAGTSTIHKLSPARSQQLDVRKITSD